MRSKLTLRFGKGARGIKCWRNRGITVKWNAVLRNRERPMIQLVQMALRDVFDSGHETFNGLGWCVLS